MKKIIVITTVLALALAFAAPAFAWTSPAEMRDHKISILEQRIQDGVITPEQGKAIREAITERMENCEGFRSEDRERLGQTFAKGLGFGRSGSKGTGRRAGQ